MIILIALVLLYNVPRSFFWDVQASAQYFSFNTEPKINSKQIYVSLEKFTAAVAYQ